MRFTDIPFFFFFTTLILIVSVASTTYIRSEAFQPGLGFDEYEPFEITLFEPTTRRVIHTETVPWQIVSHLSEEEGGDPYEISLAGEYNIPAATRDDFDSLQYLLTGGPGDGNLLSLCSLNDDGEVLLPLEPGVPVAYRLPRVSTVFCFAVVDEDEEEEEA